MNEPIDPQAGGEPPVPGHPLNPWQVAIRSRLIDAALAASAAADGVATPYYALHELRQARAALLKAEELLRRSLTEGDDTTA